MNLSGYSINERKNLPDSPGIYKYFNQNNDLIYVGKAKSLKKRVNSYFNKNTGHNRKTIKLVKEIHTYDFTIVDTELDALLLENNLIKEYQPKYNILLKDDKTFPYICIVKERFPRVITTRKFDKNYGEYFGPYSSVVAMHTVLNLIRKTHKIRTCKLNLSEYKIVNEQYKVCLEYHIGNCKGPCENLQSEIDYNNDIESIRHILKGNLSFVRNYFKDKMNESASRLNFETAQNFKEKLDYLEKFQVKSTIVNIKLSNLAIFTLVSDDKFFYLNHLFVTNGAITNTQTFEVKKVLEETEAEILEKFSFDILKEKEIASIEILSNCHFQIGLNTSFIPQIGDKEKLLKLSIKNALEHKKNKILKTPIKDRSTLILEQLKIDLRLTELPNHIECFDNSNIQGTNPVASMVCFRNAKPAKKEYRHYHIKTVIGPDDFTSMYEIVLRRYTRLLKENEPLPKLIVIDGGKGQLSKACEALQDLNIYGRIPIIGIAKKLEEIYFPNDSIPLHINKKSGSLILLQKIRDEAHRFAITFHRNLRSKNSLNSEIEQISGIGSATMETLIKEFKSVKKIKQSSFEELKRLVGKSKAQIIVDHYK